MSEMVLIVAVSDNNAIGKGGTIPWHIPEDFSRFKKMTMGHPCIMGRKTFESLPDNARPLPGRLNIVLTSDRQYEASGAIVVHSWEEALERADDSEKVFICGGAEVYRLAMDDADTIELTRVHRTIEDADTFFPDIDLSVWKLVSEEKHEEYSFLTYKRK